MNFNPKISHEFPLSLLDFGAKITDYDYALVHKIKECEPYRDFFKRQIEKNREVILDNSLFELGESFQDEEFLSYIKMIKPTFFVVPDVFNDVDKNLERGVNFLNKYDTLKESSSLPIFAIHGKTFKELTQAYDVAFDIIEDYYPGGKIAIPFGSQAFELFYESGLQQEEEKEEYVNNILYRKARNRYLFLEQLFVGRNPTDLHLLGNYAPIEYTYYRESNTDYSCIKSIDTSHPVAFGLENMSYEKIGFYHKSLIKIEENFNNLCDEKTKDVILSNVRTFKDICRGEIK